MKLRARLALTLGVAAALLLVLIGWSQARFQSRIRIDALAEAAVHRMQSGGRARCEANPETWPAPHRRREARRDTRPGRPRFRPHRFFAYDTQFRSRNPASPQFPAEIERALRAGNDVASTRPAYGRPVEMAVRMPWNAGPCAIVLLRTSAPPPWFSAAVLLPAFLVALIVTVVALLAAGPLVRRVRLLTESVRRFGNHSEEPIEIDGSDEIAELGRAFEQSRQTIQTQLQSLRDREEALREYIAHTTHDVMLPLSVLQGHLVALQRRIEAGETLDAQAIVPSIEESQYLGSLLHNLNAAARLDATHGLAHEVRLVLNDLLERVVDRHRPISSRKEISLELAVPDDKVELQGDLTLLEQALNNLVQNAIRYNRAGGHVAVVLRGRTASWTLEVIDDGPGIPIEDRKRAVEPSFRGSEARTRHPHGMGLGLHIVSDVARRHGLELELHDTEGGGLTALLRPAGQRNA